VAAIVHQAQRFYDAPMTALQRREPNADPEVLWNFEKFLVARDGSVVRRFAPSVTPDDPALVEAIEAELTR
jgi:glutathione peroxidase-family protein